MALHKATLTDGSLEMDHYYLCHYVPLTVGKDFLSRSLLRFKERMELDLSAWVECSVEVLKSMSIEGCIIVRAFNHVERFHTLSALDHIGVKLAQTINCRYEPTYLKKAKDVPELKKLNRADRTKALKDVYQFVPPAKSLKSNFLILDDILTTGTTTMAIATAIREQLPSATITVFTLAKADYDLQMNEQVIFEAEHFQWHGNAWEVREDEVQYESLAELKRKIMSDNFSPNQREH